jgi:cell division protein FtsW (lipid II flippase)
MRNFLCAFAPVSAILMSVLVMRVNDVPSKIWMQQILCVILSLVVFLWAFFSHKQKNIQVSPKQDLPKIVILISLLLLLSTFSEAGMDSVHRWIGFGPVRLCVSSVMLPSFILAIYHLLKDKEDIKWVVLPSFMMICILCAQPDAAQATAFAIAMSIIWLTAQHSQKILKLGAILLSGIALFSWTRFDPLLPVPHVEQIYQLAFKAGLLYAIPSYIACLLLLVPFISRSKPIIAMGLYFLTCMIAPLIGAFPVPVFGFGLSPILGYMSALVYLIGLEFIAEKRVLVS